LKKVLQFGKNPHRIIQKKKKRRFWNKMAPQHICTLVQKVFLGFKIFLISRQKTNLLNAYRKERNRTPFVFCGLKIKVTTLISRFVFPFLHFAKT